MTNIAEWAKEQRQKGTEIKEIRGKYYLCKVSSKWDSKIKRSRKISGEYLGVLTPKGLVPAQRKLVSVNELILSKEFGASWFLNLLTQDIKRGLQIRFPDIWKELYAICILRTVRPCSFRYIAQRYESSVISQSLSGLALSGSSITSLLKNLGQRRQAISLFMKDFLQGEKDYLIFDGTNLVTYSKAISDAQVGYNSKGIYDPQINLLYAFTNTDNRAMPGYYRKFPGSIRDVSAFVSLTSEIGVRDFIVIADKGFGSDANFKELDEAKVKYIIPLRRNNKLYDRSPLMAADKSGFESVFQFNGRPIWAYRQSDEHGHQLVVYLDGELRLKEEKDYLRRMFEGNEGYCEAALRAKQLEFGTIVVKTNLVDCPEKLYCLYKKRGQIEQMFDDYKNLLDLDTSYLGSDVSMEAWLFLNHLGLMACYRVYELLHSTQSLKKYSVGGVLQEYLSSIRIGSITGSWRYEVMTKRNKKLLKQLNLRLPEKPQLNVE